MSGEFIGKSPGIKDETAKKAIFIMIRLNTTLWVSI
jgi:hypothetical protein